MNISKLIECIIWLNKRNNYNNYKWHETKEKTIIEIYKE